MPNYLDATCKPDARLVDALRLSLSANYSRLDAIRGQLTYADGTQPCEFETLGALRYLEERGEVLRESGRGWRKRETLLGLSELQPIFDAHEGRMR